MKQSNLARMFKALSNEQRLKLFLMIYDGCLQDKGKKEPSCCGSIEKAFTAACGCLKISKSTISHHFKELQDSGLIRTTRQGQGCICEVNEDAIDLIKNFLKRR